MEQAVGPAVDAQGRLRLGKTNLIVGEGMFVVEGNDESRMIADAEGQIALVQVFHGQSMVEGAALQRKGGHQPEIIGEHLHGLFVGAQLQHQGIRALIHEGVLQQPSKAVLGGFEFGTLGLDNAVRHLAAVGEENRRVIAPDVLIRLPHVLHAVTFADNAFNLGSEGSDRHLQVVIFQKILHRNLPLSGTSARLFMPGTRSKQEPRCQEQSGKHRKRRRNGCARTASAPE